MTLDYWNTQFQFTKVLPDFQDCLKAMEDRSANVDLDFERPSHGPDPRQFAEVSRTPISGQILPVFIHGGYWRALTAEMHRFVLPALAQHVGGVGNIEYRLLPHVTLAEIVSDALNGLRVLADQTGCRLLLVGHSAGAIWRLWARYACPILLRALFP